MGIFQAKVAPSSDESSMKSTSPILSIVSIVALVISIATMAMTISIVVKVYRDNTSPVYKNLKMSDQIEVEEVMSHLRQLQEIGDRSNGNRAVNTIGFNRTLDYITRILESQTNFKVTRDYFFIRLFELAADPVLSVTIDGTPKSYVYNKDPNKADFFEIEFSTKQVSMNFESITVIPNLGCDDADWRAANPSPRGRVVLVRRGICSFDSKGRFANHYNASGILIYNDGATPDRVKPISIGLGQDNQIPALFLSYDTGIELYDAAMADTESVKVQMTIDVKDLPDSPVGNICADTLEGDPTKIISIGSHSDSVKTGPGINDNGKHLLFQKFVFSNSSVPFQAVVVQQILH